MTLVVDASLVVAAFTNKSHVGVWAEQMLSSDDLAAPHLLLVEAAHVLRRLLFLNEVSLEEATESHERIVSLRFDFFPYEPYSWRIWDLRPNVRPYDAWYVAIAESLDAPLGTLDNRLVRASGPQCRFLTPP